MSKNDGYNRILRIASSTDDNRSALLLDTILDMSQVGYHPLELFVFWHSGNWRGTLNDLTQGRPQLRNEIELICDANPWMRQVLKSKPGSLRKLLETWQLVISIDSLTIKSSYYYLAYCPDVWDSVDRSVARSQLLAPVNKNDLGDVKFPHKRQANNLYLILRSLAKNNRPKLNQLTNIVLKIDNWGPWKSREQFLVDLYMFWLKSSGFRQYCPSHQWQRMRNEVVKILRRSPNLCKEVDRILLFSREELKG